MTVINARFESGGEGFSMAEGLALGVWQSSGGSPNGYFAYTDLGLADVNYYRASNEFEGQKSAYFKGTLSYDIFDSGSDLGNAADIKLVGQNGVVLVAQVGQAGADWTHFSLHLDTRGGWRIDSLDGPLATAKDIRHVLKDVDQLLVRADYSTGLDQGGLDNLRLHTQPHHDHRELPAEHVAAIVHHQPLVDASHFAVV